MNADQFGGLLRAILTAAGGFVAGKGWIPLPLINEIVGALVTVGVGFWSWKTNTSASMISSVAAIPEVSKVVTTPAMAAADPSSKVTSS